MTTLSRPEKKKVEAWQGWKGAAGYLRSLLYCENVSTAGAIRTFDVCQSRITMQSLSKVEVATVRSLIHICSWLPSVCNIVYHGLSPYLQSWDLTCWMVLYFFTYDLFSSFALMRDMMKFMPDSTFNAALMLTKSSSDHLHQPVSPSLLNRGQFVCFHKILVNINCVK